MVLILPSPTSPNHVGCDTSVTTGIEPRGEKGERIKMIPHLAFFTCLSATFTNSLILIGSDDLVFAYFCHLNIS